MPLKIKIPKQECFNEETEMFYETEKEYELVLEHSLVSISKWESRWHIPYLKEDSKKTTEQVIDYLRCMTIAPKEVPDEVYNLIPASEIEKITKYINDPMTATTVRTFPEYHSSKREILSSELLYYYMFEAGIPKDCEKWHINRLLTLINIYGIKREDQNPNKKKMSRSELIARNRDINARNKKRFNSRG